MQKWMFKINEVSKGDRDTDDGPVATQTSDHANCHMNCKVENIVAQQNWVRMSKNYYPQVISMDGIQIWNYLYCQGEIINLS